MVETVNLSSVESKRRVWARLRLYFSSSSCGVAGVKFCRISSLSRSAYIDSSRFWLEIASWEETFSIIVLRFSGFVAGPVFPVAWKMFRLSSGGSVWLVHLNMLFLSSRSERPRMRW